MKLGKANTWSLLMLDQKHEYSGQVCYAVSVKSAVRPNG